MVADGKDGPRRGPCQRHPDIADGHRPAVANLGTHHGGLQTADYLGRRADMPAVSMGEDDSVEVIDSERAQVGQERSFEFPTASAVEKPLRTVARAEVDCAAASGDIEHVNLTRWREEARFRGDKEMSPGHGCGDGDDRGDQLDHREIGVVEDETEPGERHHAEQHAEHGTENDDEGERDE